MMVLIVLWSTTTNILLVVGTICS